MGVREVRMRWIHSITYDEDDNSFEVVLSDDATIEQIALAEEFAQVLLALASDTDRNMQAMMQSAYEQGMADAINREMH